jgi:hypothetical protein
MKSNNISQYLGPGFWYMIHKSACLVKSNKEEDECISKIKKMIDVFPCDDCSNHGKRYYKNNPMEEYKGITNDDNQLVGIFLWTVSFHNAVNLRIGKDPMGFEDALELYSGNEKCEDLCDISKYI